MVFDWFCYHGNADLIKCVAECPLLVYIPKEIVLVEFASETMCTWNFFFGRFYDYKFNY